MLSNAYCDQIVYAENNIYNINLNVAKLGTATGRNGGGGVR